MSHETTDWAPLTPSALVQRVASKSAAALANAIAPSDALRIAQTNAELLKPGSGLDDATAVLTALEHALHEMAERDVTFVEPAALASQLLSRLAFSHRDMPRAHALLDRARRGFEQLNLAAHTCAVHLEVAILLSQAGDVDGLATHLDQAAEQFAAVPDKSTEPVLGRMLHDQLAHSAVLLDYDAGRSELAIRLATQITRLFPDDPDGWRIRGNASTRIGRWQLGADSYVRVTELLPTDESAWSNLAAALINLGRIEDALGALDRTLALAPDKVPPRTMRAQLRAQAGDVAGAIADFEHQLDVLEANCPVDDGTTAGTLRYRDHCNLRMTTYAKLLEVHRKASDRNALLATARRLAAADDDALGAAGHRLLGELAREAGELTAARAAYSAAIAAFARDGESRLARARVAVDQGDWDAAIADLAHLAPRDRSPTLAITGLEELRTRSDRAEILRWLGFAQLEVFDLTAAEANLDAYLARVPDDVEARRWLGLALISADIDHAETPDPQRLLRGLEELSRAADAGDADAAAILQRAQRRPKADTGR